jgi:hypothetical protein
MDGTALLAMDVFPRQAEVRTVAEWVDHLNAGGWAP